MILCIVAQFGDEGVHDETLLKIYNDIVSDVDIDTLNNLEIKKLATNYFKDKYKHNKN